MNLLSKLEKRPNRILIAVLIGFIFACGAFLVQRTAEPLNLSHMDQTKIKYQSYSNVLTLYNGINQVKLTAYSGISEVPSKATKIKVFAVPSGGDPYSGYQLPSYQYNYPEITLILGGSQEYSQAGVAANCYVSQLPTGMYYIAFLTENADGNSAYTVTNYSFENGLYEGALNLLFFLFAFANFSDSISKECLISMVICTELKEVLTPIIIAVSNFPIFICDYGYMFIAN
ncbi:MAG: hypothetical protein WCP73_04320 [Eubacteriales bacterium]